VVKLGLALGRESPLAIDAVLYGGIDRRVTVKARFCKDALSDLAARLGEVLDAVNVTGILAGPIGRRSIFLLQLGGGSSRDTLARNFSGAADWWTGRAGSVHGRYLGPESEFT
jgi:hypothetical protein